MGVAIFVQDITERKRAEEAVRESEGMNYLKEDPKCLKKKEKN